MGNAKKGDNVKVHYIGKLDNGTVFDASRERGEPLEFMIGDEEIIPGFSLGIEGMEPGQEKTIRVMPDEAYGPHVKDLVSKIPKDNMPEDLKLEVGQQLEISSKDEMESVYVTVTHLDDDHITVDGNHPLAGKELTFDIELMEISDQ